MHKRKTYKKLTHYFYRLNQENRDYIISLMIKLFQKQYENKSQRSESKNSDDIIYLYRE